MHDKATGMIVISTEGGSLFRGALNQRNNNSMESSDSKHWTISARKFLQPLKSNTQEALLRHVNAYGKLHKVREIDCTTLFDSKPALDILYPSVSDGCLWGTVTTCPLGVAKFIGTACLMLAESVEI